METKVILSEPTPLTEGKTVPAQLAAARANWYSLRQLGHTGCVVEHYCWDRANIVGLDRETRKWHLEQDLPALPAHISPATARLTEFVLVTPCALHDSQNGFRWSLIEQMSNKELMRDIYIGIESLRRSQDLIQEYMFEWLGKVRRAREDQGEDWVNRRRQVWLGLSVDMETADLLAADLQVYWDGNTLWTLRGALQDRDVVSALASALLACWRFQKFSDSRWLTVGSSARNLVVGFLTGIESLVKFIDKNPAASKFYLKGFGRMEQSRKQFLVYASIVSVVAEQFQCQLMKDSRVAKNSDKLWQATAKAVRWVVDLPAQTFALLGSVCGLGGEQIANVCIGGAHTSLEFIWRRVLSHADALPWSLVRGDIAENLRELAAGSKPDEPASGQLWELMNQNFNVAQLVATVELFGEVSWTSLPAEQQHASLSGIHRWHHEYGTHMLICRAFMVQLAKILPRQSKLDKKKAKVIRKMDAIMRACPEKVTGRHMLVKAMLGICIGRRDEGRAGYGQNGARLAQCCMNRQGPCGYN